MTVRYRTALLCLCLLCLCSCSLFRSDKPKRPSAASQRTVTLNEARKYVGKLLWPVPRGSVSSRFGQRWSDFHEGIDIKASEGTPIYAAHSGTVVYSSNGLRGYGNMIVLKGEGLLTVYGHNRKNRVKVGELVKIGDHIADLGKTGKATGPHLHFETRVKDASGQNVAVDPIVFYQPKKQRS